MKKIQNIIPITAALVVLCVLESVAQAPLNINIDRSAAGAGLTVRGAVVIAETFSTDTEGVESPRIAPVMVSHNGKIREWLLYVEDGIVTAKICSGHISQWADYVFDESYQLMPLAGVADFISENKHLPGIPSAVELADHGYEPAEMQKNFLAKIEELTLHLIDQKEKINHLNEVLQPYMELEKSVKGLKQAWGLSESPVDHLAIKRPLKAPAITAETYQSSFELMHESDPNSGKVGVNLRNTAIGSVFNISGRVVIMGYGDIDPTTSGIGSPYTPARTTSADQLQIALPNFSAAEDLRCGYCEDENGESEGIFPINDLDNPEFLLFVDGGIASGDWICKDLKDEWGDYVFDQDYELRPLEQVKQFIVKNGHLPEVPAADEVARGYELGQMTRILMVKIEELYLYVLQQDDQLGELKARLAGYQNGSTMERWRMNLTEIRKQF
jgi:hypothetical protein